MVALTLVTPRWLMAQLRTAADASVAYPFLRAFSIRPHPISTSPSALGGPFKLIDPTTVLEHRSTMTRMHYESWLLSARNALRCHDKSAPRFGSSGRNVKPVRSETLSKSPAISASTSSGTRATRSKRSVSMLDAGWPLHHDCCNWPLRSLTIGRVGLSRANCLQPSVSVVEQKERQYAVADTATEQSYGPTDIMSAEVRDC